MTGVSHKVNDWRGGGGCQGPQREAGGRGAPLPRSLTISISRLLNEPDRRSMQGPGQQKITAEVVGSRKRTDPGTAESSESLKNAQDKLRG